jgi:hypothetical protein
MIPIYVHGWGAVSPVGWGITSLVASLATDQRPKSTQIQRPDGFTISVHKVPIRNPRPSFLALPRLRRASPIAHYIVGAGLEASGLTDRPTGQPTTLPEKSRPFLRQPVKVNFSMSLVACSWLVG